MNISTNGDQIVDHYAARYPSMFAAIANGTVNRAPQQGDVLSLSDMSSFHTGSGGHTAVVQSSSVDANGNGQLSVEEENAAANGHDTVSVRNWVVQPLYRFSYIKWLHPTPAYTFRVLGEAQYAPDGHSPADLSHAWMGETGLLSVAVQNTGTATWRAGPSISVGTTQSTDLLYSPGWVNPQRPAVLPAGVTVPPGGSYTFTFPFQVGVTSQASFVDHFDLVAEGVTWMPDAGISFAVSFTKTVDRAVVLRHNGPGGYTLAPDGTISAFGGAPPLTSNSIWPGWDIARGLVLRTDDLGGYVLDGCGGIHRFGNAPHLGDQSNHYWPNWDIARAIALRSDNLGGYVLDGWGSLHAFGNAPSLGDQSTHYWNGWDIARSVALTSDNGGWVLDGWGSLHAFGNAPGLGDQSSHYWNGWDIARSVASVNGGAGGYVLDGYGGIHAFGNAATLTGPYWGFDVAKALAVVPNGASGTMVDGNGATHPVTLGTTPCGHPC